MKNSSLTPDDILKIARLARLPLSDTEVATYTKQLSAVLDYFNKLDEVNTDDIEPTYQSVPDENRFQELPEGSETLSVDDVLKNAPENKDGYVLTKAVIEYE